MAMVSASWPASTRPSCRGAGRRTRLLKTTMAMKPKANQGITRPPPAAWASPVSPRRIHHWPTISRKGTSSITRTSLTITALARASGPTASPAATTWATSWTVAPI